MNNNSFYVEKDGQLIKCEIIFIYEDTVQKKNYIAYTDNETDENGNTLVYISMYDPSKENSVLTPIEDKNEWERLSEIFSKLL